MPVRASVAIGLVGTALAVVLVGSLHVVYAGDVDPVRRTISEYALRDLGWMFDIGVLALAAGSVAVLVALVRAGLVRWPSFAAVGMLMRAGQPRLLAVAALAWLGAILSGVVLRPFSGVPWWQFLPLGIMERGLALTEVAVVVALAFWAGSRSVRVEAGAALSAR
jgi:uncharacterized protein DUF998